MNNKKKNRSVTVKRLVKLLFSFYPKLLPLIIILILVNALISSLPSIFQQNIVAILQKAWENGIGWEIVRPEIMHYIVILASLYLTSLLAGVVYNQLMAIFTQGVLNKIRIKLFDHMETLPIRYFDTHQRGDVMSYYFTEFSTTDDFSCNAYYYFMYHAILQYSNGTCYYSGCDCICIYY